MAEQTVRPGGILDFLTRHELREELAQNQALAIERERLRSVKPVRFSASGTPASSAVTIGGDSAASGALLGPEQGYVWSIRHLVVRTLTRGATPDVLQFFVNNSGGYPLWELNGNVWAQTFGRGEVLLYGGETLFAQNQGTFAATAAITMRGLAENIPGEMIGKLY